jgi:hypothetical protein
MVAYSAFSAAGSTHTTHPAAQCVLTGRVKARGAAKKNLTKVTYICRSAKKKVGTYFILFYFYFCRFFTGVFWAFRNKGSSKTREKLFFEKVHLGSGLPSQKMRFFFLRFVRFFFNRVFGRFVTRGVQKRDKKKRDK